MEYKRALRLPVNADLSVTSLQEVAGNYPVRVKNIFIGLRGIEDENVAEHLHETCSVAATALVYGESVAVGLTWEDGEFFYCTGA